MMVYVLAAVLAGSPVAASNADDDAKPISCAAASLYFLCRSEGADVRLDEVSGFLPYTPQGSYLTELLEAADRLGIRLRARAIDEEGADLPRKPFIAYLKPAPGEPLGHFVALRPVVPGGSQYQLIDPPNYPHVFDERDILRWNRFAGPIVTRRPTVTFREACAYALILLGVGGLFLPSVWRALRERRQAVA
jgi:hypothetical protein